MCTLCVCVCVYVYVVRGTPTVTILLCCQLVPPTVLNRHACTHTRMHAHTHPDTHTHTTHTHTHTHTITGVQQRFCLLLCVYVMMVCTNAYVLLRSGLGIPCWLVNGTTLLLHAQFSIYCFTTCWQHCCCALLVCLQPYALLFVLCCVFIILSMRWSAMGVVTHTHTRTHTHRLQGTLSRYGDSGLLGGP